MRTLVALVLVGALVVVGAPSALAQPDHAAALTSLQRGVDAFRAGRYRAALPAFEAAQRLAPDKPNPYRWMALVHMQLGDCPRVLTSVTGFLSRASANDSRRAELVRLRRLCRATGVLRVRARPARVDLRIDGRSVGTTPYTSLSMRAGEHTLVAAKPGFRSQSRAVSVTAGRQHEVTFHLSRPGKSITRRWWFWTAIVGTVAAVAGVAIVVADDSSPTTLPPIRCGAAGCR